jgi:hypothetical protein
MTRNQAEQNLCNSEADQFLGLANASAETGVNQTSCEPKPRDEKSERAEHLPPGAFLLPKFISCKKVTIRVDLL